MCWAGTYSDWRLEPATYRAGRLADLRERSRSPVTPDLVSAVVVFRSEDGRPYTDNKPAGVHEESRWSSQRTEVPRIGASQERPLQYTATVGREMYVVAHTRYTDSDCKPPEKSSRLAVSYTHLDVYKRQHINTFSRTHATHTPLL